MARDQGLDDVLSAVGFGIWQLPVLVLTVLSHVVIPIHMMGSALLSAPVEFKCLSGSLSDNRSPNSRMISKAGEYDYFTLQLDDQNLTLITYDSKCLVMNGEESFNSGTPVTSKPLRNVTGHSTGLESCPWVTYDNSVFATTIITEWDLICEKEIMKPLFQMMYSIGAIFGGIFGGYISDSFGRKRAIQISSLVNIAATVCMYVMPWYTGILVARIFIGGSCNSMVLPAYSLALEITPPKYRTVVGMMLGTSFSMGIIIFAGIGYFIRTWRQLLMLAASIPFLIIIPLSFLIDESPRWLIQHQHGGAVYTMMARAAAKNKVKLSQSMFNTIEELREKESSPNDYLNPRGNLWNRFQIALHGIGAYFCSAPMRIILIIIPLIWILQCCLYLGIILNANNFTSNNPFIYITISGIMDLSSILVATPFSLRFGRRVLISTAFFIGGVFLMLDMVVPEEYLWIKWVLVMTALMLISASFQINFLYAPELFPTVIRARGFSLASVAGNLGFLLAPLITEILYQEAWWSVSLSFGCGGILASLLVLLLPETNHRPLPETIEDVEKRHRHNSMKKQLKKEKYESKIAIENAEMDTEECLTLTPT